MPHVVRHAVRSGGCISMVGGFRTVWFISPRAPSEARSFRGDFRG